MNDVSKKMSFEVYTDLKNPKTLYGIEIDLENEVDSYTREAAIALTGAVVRNNFKKVYDKVMDNSELSEFIKEKLNGWLPNSASLTATKVSVYPIQNKKRA